VLIEMGVHWNGTLIADVLNPANNPSGGPGTWVQYTYTGLEAESTSTVFQSMVGRIRLAFFSTIFLLSRAQQVQSPAPSSVQDFRVSC
jgi:hypothetical protein